MMVGQEKARGFLPDPAGSGRQAHPMRERKQCGMKRMRRWLAGGLLLAMLWALPGCGGETPPAASSGSGSGAASSGGEPEPVVAEPAYRHPLTGLGMDEDISARRPVAVMLNDLKAAQPQLGVSKADLIYEMPAEGGITRMVAVYQSLEGVGNLGSIRSTRAYYLELALGHDALLVHAGGSPEAYEDIPAWGVDNMDGVNGGSDAKIFWRDPERRKTMGYEHSLLTSGEAVQGYLDEGHFRTEHQEGYAEALRFTEDGTPQGGTAASHVELCYSSYKTATFDYDAAAGRYLVGQFGGAYIDGSSGQQVGVTNVLALETRIRPIPGDSAGRMRAELTGSGSGTFFCGGQSIPIRWEKASRNDPFVYRTEDGRLLELGRGVSYIGIYDPGSTGKLSVE